MLYWEARFFKERLLLDDDKQISRVFDRRISPFPWYYCYDPRCEGLEFAWLLSIDINDFLHVDLEPFAMLSVVSPPSSAK
jgi:hypothetical protein